MTANIITPHQQIDDGKNLKRYCRFCGEQLQFQYYRIDHYSQNSGKPECIVFTYECPQKHKGFLTCLGEFLLLVNHATLPIEIWYDEEGNVSSSHESLGSYCTF